MENEDETTANTITTDANAILTEPSEISEPVVTIQKWEDLNLKDELLRGIYAFGFESPSEIQKKAIYPILQKRDIIGQAQSGTGKTGTFSISTLQTVNVLSDTTQAIILLPTHELVNQVYHVLSSIGVFMEGLRVKTLVGGTSINEDMRELRKSPPHIIIGCTGRVYDMMNRKALKTDNIRLCIMDEADEMLSVGFKEQIYNIFQILPSDVQIGLFSATMPESILKITEKFMRDPVKIVMTPEELNLDGINQFFIAVNNDHEKFEVLKDLFSQLTIAQTIIYINSVARVMELYHAMTEEGFSVCAIHSNMPKAERKTIIHNFRMGSHKVLLSSNLTARGIDIQQVNTVINFDIPRSVETYLHRIGRSGRWGRKGTAINFITRHDINTMKVIEKHYGINIAEMPASYNFA